LNINITFDLFYYFKGKHILWRQTQFDGAWIKGQTAGGCGQPRIGESNLV
jgi:hypothetical protein